MHSSTTPGTHEERNYKQVAELVSALAYIREVLSFRAAPVTVDEAREIANFANDAIRRSRGPV